MKSWVEISYSQFTINLKVLLRSGIKVRRHKANVEGIIFPFVLQTCVKRLKSADLIDWILFLLIGCLWRLSHDGAGTSQVHSKWGQS